MLVCFELDHRDVAQLGRALRSGRKGRRFESCHPDQTNVDRGTARIAFLGLFVLLLYNSSPPVHRYVLPGLSACSGHDFSISIHPVRILASFFRK